MGVSGLPASLMLGGRWICLQSGYSPVEHLKCFPDHEQTTNHSKAGSSMSKLELWVIMLVMSHPFSHREGFPFSCIYKGFTTGHKWFLSPSTHPFKKGDGNPIYERSLMLLSPWRERGLTSV